jgi:cobalt-zinc-cadmium efflux system outer membrane protein
MVIKTLAFIAICLLYVTNTAADEGLHLPPRIEPNEFDRPMVQPSGDLSFQQAIILTLKHNPELATYAWTIRSKEIDQIEAGLLLNPEAQIELENFAGSGDIGAFKSAETTVALSQVIELGDKRMKRRQLASTDRDLARWDYEVKRVDLLSQTAVAFADVLGEQEKLTIANEINELADEIYQTVKKRVEAGKVSPLEEIKARVELSKTRLSQMNAERKLIISKQKLVAGWGGTEVTFNRVLGDFYNIPPLPNLTSIVNKLNNNPDIARWATEISRHQSAINLARADTIPDISVSAGLRHLNASDDVAAVASISIPLFIFNNKQTGVQRSKVELSRASKEQAVTETRLRSALIVAYQRLSILYQEVTTLKSEILPGAEEAFNAATKIYRLGKLDLLSLLDAQRIYFETRQQYVTALTEYHRVVVAIERLTGSSLDGRTDYITEEVIR